MLRQLIVNADDFGATPGVSRGIIRAHNEGIVTSTTVLANMPAAAAWIAKAQADAPGLGLGLHLNLTKGRPAAPAADVPDLVDESGLFHPRDEVIRRLPQTDMAQVEREFRAQIAAFEAAAGATPDHLDSHHHVAFLSPPMAALTASLATELDVPVRRPLPGAPGDIPAAADALQTMVDVLPSRAYVEEMSRILQSMIDGGSITTTDRFVVDFYGPTATLGDLLLILMALEEGVTELMCHPGEADDELRSSSGYADRRADELAALTHPSARELAASEFIQLITYADLKRIRS